MFDEGGFDMNESVKNKMITRCKWIWGISNTIFILSFIVLMLAVLFDFALFLKPASAFAIDFWGGDSVLVHFSSIQGEFPSNGLTTTLATNAKVICLVLWNVEILLFLPRLYIFWKVSNLFDSFHSDGEQTPFTKENCKSLSKISYALILIGLISKMLPNIVLVMFKSAKFLGVTFDVNYVFLGCIVLALSYFFEYGVVLQQESDELL